MSIGWHPKKAEVVVDLSQVIKKFKYPLKKKKKKASIKRSLKKSKKAIKRLVKKKKSQIDRRKKLVKKEPVRIPKYIWMIARIVAKRGFRRWM